MGKSYLANPLLKKCGIVDNFTPDQIAEYATCARNPLYFLSNYVKIITLDQGLVGFNPYKYQIELTKLIIRNRYTIAKWPRQSGKALDVETPILTTEGFTLLKNLRVGDKVFGPDGKSTNVTFITEAMSDHECYKVSFSNGDSVIADADHLWEVENSNWNKRQGKDNPRLRRQSKILTTRELIKYVDRPKNVSKPYIRISDALKTDKLKGEWSKVTPYAIGLWLGDGNSGDGRITCKKNDYNFYKSKLDIKTPFTIDKRTKDTGNFLISGLNTWITKNNFKNNKHLPANWALLSNDEKIWIVRGLMDSDGHCDKGGDCDFSNKNENIVDGLRTILASLGIQSSKRQKIVNDQVYWILRFKPSDFNPFYLPRKANRFKIGHHPKLKRLFIHKIESVVSRPVRCLQVDNESHLFLCGRNLIPTHNTTILSGIMLWLILFHDQYSIALLAHKAAQAREILTRIKLAYENVPLWMQQGVKKWNEGNIELENGASVIAAATSSSAIRGQSINMVYLDEFAFVPNHIADKFFTSVLPTISAGKETKIVITSTPFGLNLFYKLWHDAEQGRNDYQRLAVNWWDTPGRDDKWKKEQIRLFGGDERKFLQEYSCQFLGSTNTLIDPDVLARLAPDSPIKSNESGLSVYKLPQPNRFYVMTVDVAKGLNKDYSAFIVFDITSFPYTIAATYYNNEIPPALFPTPIYEVGRWFNLAHVLIERNDIGQEVTKILQQELEYENLLYTVKRPGKVVEIAYDDSGNAFKSVVGLDQNKTTKRIGCMALKALVESNKLIINDFELISELSKFSQKKQSWEAEEGHDDLVMCAANFGWLSTQRFLQDITNLEVRKALAEANARQLEDSIAPVGIRITGQEDMFIVDEKGVADATIPGIFKTFEQLLMD